MDKEAKASTVCLLLVLVAAVMTCVITGELQHRSWTNAAVEADVGEYDSKTGVFKWKKNRFPSSIKAVGAANCSGVPVVADCKGTPVAAKYDYHKLSRDNRKGDLTEEEYKFLRDNMPKGDYLRNLTTRELEAIDPWYRENEDNGSQKP